MKMSNYLDEILQRQNQLKIALAKIQISNESLTQSLGNIHPDVSQEDISTAITKISNGIDKIADADIENINNPNSIIRDYNDNMSPESIKGFYIQFIENLNIGQDIDSDLMLDSQSLASLPIESIENKLVEYLSYSAKTIVSSSAFSQNDDIEQSQTNDILDKLKTKEDILLFATSFYSISLEKEELKVYTIIPEAIGSIITTQAQILSYYNENINITDNKENNLAKISAFIEKLLMCLLSSLFVLLIGMLISASPVFIFLLSSYLASGIIFSVINFIKMSQLFIPKDISNDILTASIEKIECTDSMIANSSETFLSEDKEYN